jgi:hypothetical protein
MHKGAVLPGPGAADVWNDMAFALPGSVQQSYFETKRPLVERRLAGLAPLWEIP